MEKNQCTQSTNKFGFYCPQNSTFYVYQIDNEEDLNAIQHLLLNIQQAQDQASLSNPQDQTKASEF